MTRHHLRVVAALVAVTLLAACSRAIRPEAERTSKLTVLFVADLHGQLEPHPELFWNEKGERVEAAGGFARIAAAIEAIRREQGRDSVLVIDGGDTIQGSGVAALTEGAAIIPALNGLGIDVGVPGNWEVVYGTPVLRQRIEEIAHPLIAANVRDTQSGERVFEPYLVREVGGVRVAVVGYTDPEVPLRQPPAYSKGFSYDGPEDLRGLVDEVRTKHGAEVVLLASHIGLAKAVALAGDLPGVDLHLSSDTHERTYEPIERHGTWIVEPGAFGSFLGRLDLEVRDGRITDRRWELIELTASRFPEEAPEVRTRVDESLAPLKDRLDHVIGHTEAPLARYAITETTLDNLLSDALREATGTDIALSNGFRFGTPILPGPITQFDLWNAYPIVTPLKTGVVTGRQLLDFWERELENVFATNPAKRFGGWLPRPSGMEVTFEAGAPAGERVREIRVGGEPLELDRRYSITACEREGDLPDTVCRIPNVLDPRVLDFDAHDAVRRYLAKRERIHAPLEGRVRGVDLPEVLRTLK